MKKINKYICDYNELYKKIAKSKHRSKSKDGRSRDRKKDLNDIEQDIFNAYAQYEKLQGDLGSIANINLTDDQKESLIHSYENNGKHFAEVYEKIYKLNTTGTNDNCPYCSVYAVETVDHYLPKEEFPEYAFFPPNLIPSCSKCNTNKNKFWRSNKNRRYFIHVYYDDIPDERILFAKINHLDLTAYSTYLPCIIAKSSDCSPISFYLCNRLAKINHDTYVLIETHFDKLDILSRYEECFKPDVEDFWDELVTAYTLASDHLDLLDEKGVLDILRNNLNKEIDKQIKKTGNFSRSTAMKYALFECDDFLLYLRRKKKQSS